MHMCVCVPVCVCVCMCVCVCVFIYIYMVSVSVYLVRCLFGSIPRGRPSELFFVPASAPQLV